MLIISGYGIVFGDHGKSLRDTQLPGKHQKNYCRTKSGFHGFEAGLVDGWWRDREFAAGYRPDKPVSI